MNKERTKAVFNTINRYLALIFLSLLLNYIIETICRGSFSLSASFLLNSPLTFIYNSFLILLTLSCVLLIKRKIWGCTIISLFWIGFSIANHIIQKLRGTPLCGSDLKLVKSGLSIMQNYLSKKQILLIVLAFIALIAFLVFMFIFAPKDKHKNNYFASIAAILILFLSTNLITTAALNNGIISNNFWDLIAAYDEYGFAYAFNNTLINTGISKPKDYSSSEVYNILASIENKNSITTLSSSNVSINDETISKPNIIMVQLESFFDPLLIDGVKVDTDPIPNFRKLTHKYSSGNFQVSTVGGGTANTEFETITGMNLDFFGPGEYPYNTILKTHTSESINYALKEAGYTTHAIHNHEANFYGRNIVFKNLGFDTFTPVEYMYVTDRTPVGWAKDSVLTQSIVDCLTSTDNEDFIYTISVQGHGSYPDDSSLTDKHVNVKDCPSSINKNALEYYCNQIYEMDQFVNDLIETVSNIDEDTVIVFYGDHLPGLGLTSNLLSTDDLYSTTYVIWDNIGLEKNDENLEAYQLTSRVLHDLNMDSGLLTKLHQQYLYQNPDESLTKDQYDDELEMLQYDLLYGKGYAYKDETPYEPSDMHIGINPISVSKIYLKDNKIYAEGENFTYNTILLINNNYCSVTLVDRNTLYCDAPDLRKSGNTVRVIQFTGGLKVLASSPEFILGEPASGILQ